MRYPLLVATFLAKVLKSLHFSQNRLFGGGKNKILECGQNRSGMGPKGPGVGPKTKIWQKLWVGDLR
jgi:hypothetical protein